MSDDALPEEWKIIRNWLPEDLEFRARKDKFIQRGRGLDDGEKWLRLILMHAAGGLSLDQTTLRAQQLGMGQISAVALFKRLRSADLWLRNLCQYLISKQNELLGECNWPSEYQVRAIDASDIQEPGSKGTDWRIHYSIQLPQLVCDHYELTDVKGGEKLGRFQFAPNDLILADRGYSHRAGAALVLESGAALLMRWNPRSFPVKARNGAAFNLLENVRTLSEMAAGEWPIQFEWQGKTYDMRLCAIRKSRQAAERAKRKARRKAQRNRTQLQAQSLELAEYVLVLTSLPPQYSAAQVLQLYRCRWQIELAFKRLKTLLCVGQVPKSQDRSAKAWIQAKILMALLMERLLIEAKIFSPWGYPLRDNQPLETGL